MNQRIRLINAIGRRACSNTTKPTTKPAGTSSTSNNSTGVNINVPGLSTQCVKPATQPVGPGASPTAAYKVPEYFSFNRFSFAEAEVEMAKFRLPQPTASTK